MFRENCPLYMRDVTFKTETIDGETRRIVVLAFKKEPFTKDDANALNITRHLFSADSGEPFSDFINGSYGIAVPLQTLEIASAPDAPTAITLRDVKVSGVISVRKDKENPVLAANLAVSFPYPEAKELLYLASSVNNQLFCTFQVQQEELALTTPEKPRLAQPSLQESTTVK